MSGVTAVLLIEDNLGDVRLLQEMLNEQVSSHTRMTHVGDMRAAENHLAAHHVDVILLDLGLPDAQGLDAVRRAHAAAPRVPLVVLTGLDDELVANEALQEGAQDYLVKGEIETRGLSRALRYAVERKILDETLFVEKELAQVTLNCIADAVICTDVSGNITFLNAVAERLTGWPWNEAARQPMGQVFQLRDAEATTDPILIRRDGSEIAIESSVATIHGREGQTAGAVTVFRDVSAQRAVSLQMTHSTHHDFLTGLPNRKLLEDRVRQAVALAQRHLRPMAVMFMDLDGFKHINDSLGHAMGDKLLQSVANRLVACARASDTVSRQGGDEFVVLLPEIDHADGAAMAASKMLKAVAEPHAIDEHELYVTASIGVSIFPDDGQDAETLVKHADTAMYQAKQDGRQSYQFFRPEMNARAVERQSTEASLRRALERNEFELHYQPKVDFKTGAISGAEALIRWNHPTRGVMQPAQFIAIAEACGLIRPIDNWVQHRACEQAQAWLDEGLPLGTMAVNVSAVEFRDEGFVSSLNKILDDTGFDAKRLELELTESVLIRNVESVALTLQTLRERGVQVAIDDFGTGYSSLSYLRKFPIDTLKIDRSFVSEIATAGNDTSIVTAVIDIARSLKLRVVAEGVETLEQLTFLRAHACDEAQGFYFGQPLPALQFAGLLRTGIAKM
jgi:diguanylate cyclase (GGDEF)-like protein